MASNNAPLWQAATDTAVVPGFWKLAAERAVTLNPGETGVLRIAQGHVWVTLDGPHQGPANDRGDLVLHAGEQLRLMRGQHAVVESFGDAVNEPVYFSWEPTNAPVLAVPTDDAGWRDVLARPTLPGDDEIMVSVRALGRVLGRVFTRLAASLQYLMAGKGRVLQGFEANQP